MVKGELTSSPSFAAAAASRWALALPELSPRSSSSFFSFLAPPPNMENTDEEVTAGLSSPSAVCGSWALTSSVGLSVFSVEDIFVEFRKR
jgi:hypothetical protein